MHQKSWEIDLGMQLEKFPICCCSDIKSLLKKVSYGFLCHFNRKGFPFKRAKLGKGKKALEKIETTF